MNTAAWLPRRGVPETANASLRSETRAGDAAMIGHDRSRKATPGARLRGFQHVCTGSHHDSGPVGPSRRDLRSLALVPCAVLALRPEIPSLSGAAHRSGGVPGLCREVVIERSFRRAAADP